MTSCSGRRLRSNQVTNLSLRPPVRRAGLAAERLRSPPATSPAGRRGWGQAPCPPGPAPRPRPAPPRLVGLAELHADAPHAAHPAVLPTDEADGLGEPVEAGA